MRVEDDVGAEPGGPGPAVVKRLDRDYGHVGDQDSFYLTLIRGVQEVAHHHDRQVLVGSSDEDPDRERELILDFCSQQVDGLIVVPAGGRHGYLVPQIRTVATLVFVYRPAGDILADTVLVDNAGGTAKAVRHLARHRHRRAAYFGDAPHIFTAAERLRGFRTGCGAAGLSVKP